MPALCPGTFGYGKLYFVGAGHLDQCERKASTIFNGQCKEESTERHAGASGGVGYQDRESI